MNTFLAIDFETSHLDPNVGAPVQIGAAMFRDGEQAESKSWVVAPPMRDGKISRCYDVRALEISGLQMKDIRKGDAIGHVLGELAVMVDDDPFVPVVAFNAAFDLAWYSTSLFLAGRWDNTAKQFVPARPPLAGPWHCAMNMARRVMAGLPNCRLDTVAEHFGFKRGGELHGALEDAALAGRVYLSLLREVETTVDGAQ